MGAGPEAHGLGALLSRGDGTFEVVDDFAPGGGEHNIDWINLYPRYLSANDWPAGLHAFRGSRVRNMRAEPGKERRLRVMKAPNEPESTDFFDLTASNARTAPHERVIEIIDGLGAKTTFGYKNGGGWDNGLALNGPPSMYAHPRDCRSGRSSHTVTR